MVYAASAHNCVFLQPAPTRSCLACIKNFRVSALDRVHKLARERRYARKPLNKVQGDPLSAENCARRTLHRKYLLIGRDSLTVLNVPLHVSGRADLGKGFDGQSQTCRHQAFPSYHMRCGLGASRNRRQARYVARSDVFLKG